MTTCETERPSKVDRVAPAAANIARRVQEAEAATRATADLPLLVQIVRYLIVGGVAFVADFGTLFVLTDLCHWYYLQSAAVAFLVGMAINYVLSIGWVFKVRAVKNRHVEFLLFASIGLAGLGINQLMLWALADGMDLFYLHAKLITAAAVLGWNFAARKLLLFTSPGSASSQEIART